MGMMTEFREFAMKGNVVDLAVGVVIGAAFGRIVTSLVEDIIMPVVGKLMGGVDFTTLSLMLSPAMFGPDGKQTTAAVLLRYGNFIQSIVNFLIVAFAIFMAVKAINRMRRAEPVVAAPAAPAEDIVLLTEIRDALRSR
jgi:large conductance mechanosensitive channel